MKDNKQEWSKEFDERWYLWNLDGLAYTTCGEEVKSFISQKLKEQRERIIEEIEKLAPKSKLSENPISEDGKTYGIIWENSDVTLQDIINKLKQ
jgi:hypothetical protein